MEGFRGSHIQKYVEAVKRLDRLAQKLAHMCRFIWEWIYSKQIALRDTRGHLGVIGVKHSKVGEAVTRQGWVQLHKITSITIIITLKYQLQLQLQLHHHNVILNYNYTMFISITITITSPFLHKLHFYLWNCGLIGFGCFPCLACCLVPTQPRNALRLHNIATYDSISCVGQLN